MLHMFGLLFTLNMTEKCELKLKRILAHNFMETKMLLQ